MIPIRSIRRFLLVNLMLLVVAATAATTSVLLFLQQKDLDKHQDNRLIQSALIMQSLLANLPEGNDARKVQERLDEMHSLYKTFVPPVSAKSEQELPRFQIFDTRHSTVLLSGENFPAAFSDTPVGFSIRRAEGHDWRVFARVDVNSHTKIIVTEQYGFHSALTRKIIQEATLVLLISYPFLGILMWIVVGYGLKTLRNISVEVQQREPEHLNPIACNDVPNEIKPIVEGWNDLFVRLQQAFEREKRFTADAAHEMKTPLAALKTHTQLALNAASESERAIALSKILTGVDRSAHVIQQLLTLNRISHGSASEPPVPVDLTKLTQEMVSELVPAALEKKDEIELIMPDHDLIILGYGTSISILVRNLVDNAIRYSPEHSSIRVILEESQGHVVLRVIDNGPGIPEQLRARVFERFYRVIGSKSPGSGLGLSIVRQIADLHQATIALDAAPDGQGLQISVTFPKIDISFA